MSWTNTPKPNSSAWNTVNPLGKEQYDDAEVFYDDSETFYDGIDPVSWSKTAKPSTSNWNSVPKPS